MLTREHFLYSIVCAIWCSLSRHLIVFVSFFMPDNSPTSTTKSDQQKIQPSSSSNNAAETTTSNYGLFKEGNLFKTAVFFYLY